MQVVLLNNLLDFVWFEAAANGGTPYAGEASTKAIEEMAIWCDAHSEKLPTDSYHITDGESTDGNPEDIASQLRLISTNDGEVLLLNLHVSSEGGTPRLNSLQVILHCQINTLRCCLECQLNCHLI